MLVFVYGAGFLGGIAADFLGWSRIEAFIDNNKAGQYVGDKPVVDLSGFVNDYNLDDSIIVVASDKYSNEMSESLERLGISNYFFFREHDIIEMEFAILPRFYLYGEWQAKSYNEVLSYYDFSKYETIGIVGDNKFLPYLLLEINARNLLNKCIILTEEKERRSNVSFGVLIGKLSDYWDQIDCLIVNTRRSESTIHEKLFVDDHMFDVVDIYDIDRLIPQFRYRELEKFKGIHKGKRVFLVGNGPSLKIEDLEKLHQNKEICFGCNKVYRAYNMTHWRADYLCMCDYRTIEACYKDFKRIEGTLFLGDSYHINKVPEIGGVQYVHLIGEHFAPQMPGFSSDITYGVYMGWNIVYDLMIQIAAYMGFSEIYLLGVDHHLNDKPMENGNHFIDDYFSEEEKRLVQYDQNVFDMNSKSLGYKMAELYSRKNGFRIYNATRGGALEVFERVDFDSLFRGD